MYNNVIFGLYGTLIDISTNEHDSKVWKNLAESLNFFNVYYTAEELEQTYFACCELQIQKGLKEFNNPELDIIEIFKMIFANKGKKATKGQATVLAQVFRSLSTKYIRLYDGVIELLQALKKNKKKVYILTNAQKPFAFVEVKNLDLKKYVKGIMYSSEIGCAKPDKLAFAAICQKYDLDKKDTIMVGSSSKDIVGANSYGIDSLYVRSNIIESDDTTDVKSKYKVMDGDMNKVKNILLEK